LSAIGPGEEKKKRKVLRRALIGDQGYGKVAKNSRSGNIPGNRSEQPMMCKGL